MLKALQLLLRGRLLALHCHGGRGVALATVGGAWLWQGPFKQLFPRPPVTPPSASAGIPLSATNCRLIVLWVFMVPGTQIVPRLTLLNPDSSEACF